MQLPRIIAVAVCSVVLGAQARASFPVSRVTQGWYWPFLSYPMYAIGHERGDSLVVSQLRVTACAAPVVATIVGVDSLGPPPAQINMLLYAIARDTGTSNERRQREKMTRVLDAKSPGRYCEASVWTRTVYVEDTATHHLHGTMRRAASWAMNRTSGK